MQNENEILRAVSNSPLSVQTLVLFQISIDKITIVGDLKSETEKYLADELSINPLVTLHSLGSSRFNADIENICHVEYDKLKNQSISRRNMRVEFNPNNLNDEQKKMIFDLFVSKMKNVGFSRIDIAFDVKKDLSDFYVMFDTPTKSTNFYGVDGKVETKYFGSRRSDRYIRIYNKKQQLLDVFENQIADKDYWRIEFELKHSRTEEWKKCVEDIHILQPDWSTLDKVDDQMKVYALINEPNFWGKISRNSKYKYKNMIKNISAINLGNQLREQFKAEENRLENELNFWLGN
ncbi:replication initiation protein [Aerococcus urinaeequi]|uniref:replication initiation protein n=1 Tax=Aerococcus urinaeequi TaxID=51665 RepID=UPI003AAC0CDE